jgi:hypothetical protein
MTGRLKAYPVWNTSIMRSTASMCRPKQSLQNIGIFIEQFQFKSERQEALDTGY